MRLFLYVILAVTLLILLRACYRVAETAMGESCSFSLVSTGA